MATSPAQQCFRDLKKECNETKRLTVAALISGESYTYESVVEFFQPTLEQYFECLNSLEEVDEKWYGRGQEFVIFSISEIVREYTEKKEEESTEDSGSIGDSEPDRILGFPVISQSACLAAKGRVRGQILLTVDELADYIAPIPVSVITGIVRVYGTNGELTGFSICGQKNS